MRKSMLILLACLATPLFAQKAKPTDFDYLLGDWEFSAVSKQWGKFNGLWSAVRLETGQILDEYRVLGDKGETMYVTSTLRNYNKALDRWELVGLNEGTACTTSVRRNVMVPRCISSRRLARRNRGSATTTSAPITFRGLPTAPPTAAKRG